MEPVGPTSVRSCLVAALDSSKTPLPAWLLNFIIKYLMGVLFYVQVGASPEETESVRRRSRLRCRPTVRASTRMVLGLA